MCSKKVDEILIGNDKSPSGGHIKKDTFSEVKVFPSCDTVPSVVLPLHSMVSLYNAESSCNMIPPFTCAEGVENLEIEVDAVSILNAQVSEIKKNVHYKTGTISEVDDCDLNKNCQPDGQSKRNETSNEVEENIATDSFPKNINRKTITQLRIKGSSYVTSTGKKKEKRKMGPACTSEFCKRSSHRECSEITSKERCNIFNSFWCLQTWDERHAYVAELVSKTEVKQKTSAVSSRTGTFEYSLKLPSGKIVRVCKSMFASTLGMDERTISNWLKFGLKENPSVMVKKPRTQKSGKTAPISKEERDFLKQWLNDLPTVPSHYYTQTDTYEDKKFLYPGTKLTNLHKAYQDFASASGVRALGITLFKKQFYDENMSIFVPRNDQCDISKLRKKKIRK